MANWDVPTLAYSTNYVGSSNVRDLLCFAPPLVITAAQVDRLVEATRGAIAAVLPARA